MKSKISLKYIFLILILSLFSTNIYSQSSTKLDGTYLKITIIDSLLQEPVEFATISVERVGGGSPLRYDVSIATGEATVKNLAVGSSKVKFESMGYKSREIVYNIKSGSNEINKFLVEQDATMLDELVVTDVANPILVKKDTVEFNASSFKVNETDMLEDLLKKLPGVEIDEDGVITANGEEIKKIMIDGKEFFLDDPQLATKNLPANIVEKVRVLERKSDQSRFTGIDDGEGETVIDLKVYDGMFGGWFGNVTAGYGNKDRYQAGGMVAKFTNKSSITVLANGNNTNNRGFRDIAGSNMSSLLGGVSGGNNGSFYPSGSGITTSWMSGLNANTELLDGKMKLDGNYMYTGTDKEIISKKAKQTLLNETTTLYNNEQTKNLSRAEGHRAGARFEYNISENTSILFRPRAELGSGSYNNSNTFSTLNNSDSTNRGASNSFGNNNSQSTSGFLLFRQKLGKVGRTLSASLYYSYSNNEIKGFNKSNTTYFTTDSTYTDIIDQMFTTNNKNKSLNTRVSYTEPLGKNLFIEAAYRYSYKQAISNKDTWNRGVDSSYDQLDTLYSSNYGGNFVTQNAELNFMSRQDKLSLTFGVSLQPNTTESFGRVRDTAYSNINFAPRARVDYQISDSRYLRINYIGRTKQPSLGQLLPVADNSNPLVLTAGNANLNPEFSHNLYSEYRSNNQQNYSWFLLKFNGSYTTDKIVSKKLYTDEGVQIKTYENSSKPVFNSNLRVMYNGRIASSKFFIGTYGYGGFSNSISYVLDPDNSTEKSYVENVAHSVTISEKLRLTYRDDIIEAIVGAGCLYKNAWYSVKGLDKVSTFTNSITASVNATLPVGFNISSNVDHYFYIGYDQGYNEPATVWNAELSKSLFKEKATLKVKVYDILNNSKSMYRVSNENYIQDVENNTLGQYLMFSLVYKFGDFGNLKSSSSKGPGGKRH